MILVPIRTGRGLNSREHWRDRAKRVKSEKVAAEVAILAARRPLPYPPCTVRLTRIAPSGGLDDDNLAGALKSIRDGVATMLGIDDKHSNIVRYIYAQRRGNKWGVEIEFGKPMKGEEFEPMETAPRTSARTASVPKPATHGADTPPTALDATSAGLPSAPSSSANGGTK